jgi:hypothetical protein
VKNNKRYTDLHNDAGFFLINLLYENYEIWGDFSGKSRQDESADTLNK